MKACEGSPEHLVSRERPVRAASSTSRHNVRANTVHFMRCTVPLPPQRLPAWFAVQAHAPQCRNLMQHCYLWCWVTPHDTHVASHAAA